MKIFATDVEQQNIETDGAGSYPESIAADISPHQLGRYFVKKGPRFVVKNDLRQCIVFAKHNLLSDPPFTKMDLVVCRNALIYFRSGPQERALKRLQYALVPHGHMFLGSSESLGELQSDFKPISARNKIWQMVRPLNLPLYTAKGMTYGYTGTRPALAQGGRAARLNNSAVDVGFSALIKAFAPPAAILVNLRHELVHSYGDVHKILQLREGSASLDINRILPDALKAVATALLFKANRDNASVVSDGLRLKVADDLVQHLRLSAWPAGEFEGERLTLLAFQPMDMTPASASQSTINLDMETTERIEVLERELAATRESPLCQTSCRL